jgi:stage III sporulation protein AE
MKRAKITLVLLLFFSVPFLSSYTYGGDRGEIQNYLPEEFGNKSEEELFSSLSISSVINAVLSAFSESATEVLGFFTMIFGLAVLSIAAEICTPGESLAFSRHISAATSAVIALSVFTGIHPLYQSVSDGIASISSTFGSAIPVFTAILSAGGELKSAAMGALNMNITLAAIGYVSNKLLLPLASAVFALSLLAGIDTGPASIVAKKVKGFFFWALGIVTTVLLSVFSMQSLIAGASDSAYLRAAKYAASGMIPFVGSTVSSALGTLAGGISYAKSIAGVGVVALMLGAAIAPIIKLLLYRLSFSTVISFLEFAGAETGKKSFSAFKDSVEILTAVYVMTTLVCIFEVIILIKCGGNI